MLELTLIILSGGFILFFEYYFHANWFEDYTDLFAEVGISVAIVALVVHLTFKVIRREEEMIENTGTELDGILRSMYEDVYVFNEKGKIKYYHSPDEKSRKVEDKVDLNNVPAAINEIINEALSQNTKGDIYFHSYKLSEEEGKVRYYEVLFTPYYVDSKYSGSVAVVHDDTENIRYSKDLEEAHRELQKRFNDLKTFEKVSVGRELKMVELKNKISNLERKVSLGIKTK